MNAQDIHFPSDNLIYNRFDLIYGDDIRNLSSEDKGKRYTVQLYCSGDVAKINVWGKTFPQTVFDGWIKQIFAEERVVHCVEIQAGGNTYQDQLVPYEDMCVCLPDSPEALWNRMSAKSKYNIFRNRRILARDFGFPTEVYSKPKASDVEIFFNGKNERIIKIIICHQRNILKPIM